MPTRYSALAGGLLVSLPMLLSASPGPAQETWQRNGDPRYQQRGEPYQPEPAPQRYDPAAEQDPPAPRPVRRDAYPAARPNDAYSPQASAPQVDGYPPPRVGNVNPPVDDAYRPPRPANDPYIPQRPGYAQAPAYGQPYPPPPPAPVYGQPYPQPPPGPSYGQPYSGPPSQGYGQ